MVHVFFLLCLSHLYRKVLSDKSDKFYINGFTNVFQGEVSVVSLVS